MDLGWCVCLKCRVEVTCNISIPEMKRSHFPHSFACRLLLFPCLVDRKESPLASTILLLTNRTAHAMNRSTVVLVFHFDNALLKQDNANHES